MMIRTVTPEPITTATFSRQLACDLTNEFKGIYQVLHFDYGYGVFLIRCFREGELVASISITPNDVDGFNWHIDCKTQNEARLERYLYRRDKKLSIYYYLVA